jgi:predicted acetyltransferase
VVGRVSVRHRLTPTLLEHGGHVGYAVGPRFRRRGHATEILRQSVARLGDLGVERVLVTCDDDNAGSARVIEACGGVLEDVRTVAGHPPARRYCITT